MWRLLFLFSAMVIAAALFARGWFGKRVVAATGSRKCTPNPGRWQEVIGGTLAGEATAELLGRELHRSAWIRWKREDKNAARAREAALRFGLAVPPLTGVVLIFAVAVAKLPLFGALAIALAATALSVLTGLLSIGAELHAVNRLLREVRQKRVFPRMEDEEAVAACAQAAVWMKTLPPVLGR